MRRCFSALIALLMLVLFAGNVLADDTGVQILASPAPSVQPVVMDDIRKGDYLEIPGYGNITFDSMDFVDSIKLGWIGSFDSGSEAEYLQIKFRILNTQHQPVNYMNTIENILCSFGDGYQFGGWCRQEFLDSGTTYYLYKNEDDFDNVGVLYEGRYDIVITLPNYVVESSEPLSVSFQLGGSEFTYHHRK